MSVRNDYVRNALYVCAFTGMSILSFIGCSTVKEAVPSSVSVKYGWVRTSALSSLPDAETKVLIKDPITGAITEPPFGFSIAGEGTTVNGEITIAPGYPILNDYDVEKGEMKTVIFGTTNGDGTFTPNCWTKCGKFIVLVTNYITEKNLRTRADLVDTRKQLLEDVRGVYYAFPDWYITEIETKHYTKTGSLKMVRSNPSVSLDPFNEYLKGLNQKSEKITEDPAVDKTTTKINSDVEKRAFEAESRAAEAASVLAAELAKKDAALEVEKIKTAKANERAKAARKAAKNR